MAKRYNRGNGRGWHGDSKGHALAGRKGGKSQGKHNNPGNFANRPKEEVIEAGRRGGSDSE